MHFFYELLLNLNVLNSSRERTVSGHFTCIRGCVNVIVVDKINSYRDKIIRKTVFLRDTFISLTLNCTF